MTTATSRRATTRTRPVDRVRHLAWDLHRATLALFVVLVVVELFLAGFGVFGATGRVTDGATSHSLDAHRTVGTVCGAVALISAAAALLARPRRNLLLGSLAVFLLMLIQGLLADGGSSAHALGGLHAANGTLLLLCAVGLARAEGLPRWRTTRKSGLPVT